MKTETPSPSPVTENAFLAARVDVATYERFRAAAVADNRNISSLLRVLIDAEIERHEMEKAVQS